MDDARLWVRLDPAWGPAELPVDERRWLITGHAHTHRGHFAVTAVGAVGYASVNRGDVVEASTEAAAWIEGFLAASEPSLWEFLGEDEATYDAAGDDDLARWHSWNRRFRVRGFGPPLGLMPPADLDLSRRLNPEPWVLVGDLFRVCRAGAWVVVDPQPGPPTEVFWPGTACADRRHHDLAVIGSALICETCHQVSA